MKKSNSWVVWCLGASCLLWWLVFSQDGLEQVQEIIQIDELEERGVVSRYDFAQYLNLVDCVDCLDADPSISWLYTQARRDEQKESPTRHIDDIEPGKQVWRGEEYSVCLARVLENEWMSGYPRSTSPFCPGRFCWSNILTFWEFVQTLVSLQWEKAYAFATLNRQLFKTWIDESNVVLDSASARLVDAKVGTCGEVACDIESVDEFSLYLRYCRHNLTACGMQSTDELKQGDYGIAFANILLDLGILSSADIQEMWRYTNVPSQLFLEVFDDLIQASPCVWAEDTDLDWVKNQFDSCKIDYNPSQTDQDKDGIGDVCDYDIDGDGILNSPGVVDDAWNIRFDRLSDSQDTCVITPNPNQNDRDRDGIGDVCDTDEKSLAGSDAEDYLPSERLTTWSLWINASVNQGVRPLLVDFETVSDRVIERIDWNFGDGDWSTKTTPEHIFTRAWVRTVRAVATFDDGSKAAAKQSINIQSDEGSFIAFEANADVLQWPGPLEVSLQHTYQGELDTVVWTIGEQKQTIQAGTFTQSWPVVVRQIIDFLDDYPPLVQELTLYIAPDQEDQQDIFGARLEVEKELLQVSEELEVSLEITWGDASQIASIQWKAWDVQRESTSLEETFIFDASGAKRISAHVITTSRQLLVLEATVNVLGNELCLTNTWFCDYDEDNIIDMCDEDIDGDGIKNILGLLIWENDQCRFTASVVDFDRLDEQRDRILAWEPLDNCPFVPNQQQWDTDEDGIGNDCDASDLPDERNEDTDGDGIPNEEDACPDIPENKNGTEDEDWCPEIAPGSWGGWWGGWWSWWGSSSAGSSSAWSW